MDSKVSDGSCGSPLSPASAFSRHISLFLIRARLQGFSSSIWWPRTASTMSPQMPRVGVTITSMNPAPQDDKSLTDIDSDQSETVGPWCSAGHKAGRSPALSPAPGHLAGRTPPCTCNNNLWALSIPSSLLNPLIHSLYSMSSYICPILYHVPPNLCFSSNIYLLNRTINFADRFLNILGLS